MSVSTRTSSPISNVMSQYTPLFGPDGVTVIKWVDNQCAARRRVLYQDTALANSWLQQLAITQSSLSHVLYQLTWICAANEPVDHATLFEEGSQILRGYSRLNYDEQLQWLAEDRSFRSAMLAHDQQDILQRQNSPDVHLYSLSEQGLAAQKRIHINQLQIGHLERILHQPRDSANSLAAGRSSVIQRALQPCRPPLATISANAAVQSESNRPGSLKRKRGKSVFDQQTRCPTLDDSSGDEDVPQDQVDAIQARIEATRARTSTKVQILQRKTPRGILKAAEVHVVPLPEAAREMSPHRPTHSVDAAESNATRCGDNIEQSRPCASKRAQDGKSQYSYDLPAFGLTKHDELHGGSTRVSQDPGKAFTNVAEVLSRPAAKSAGSRSEELPLLVRMKKKLATKYPEASDGAITLLAIQAVQKGLQRKAANSAKPSVSDNPTMQSLARESRPLIERNGNRTLHPAIQTQSVIDLTSSSSPQRAPRQQREAENAATAHPDLCAEQQHVVDLIMKGRNVFYTGSAGCGKSTVLKSFVLQLRDRGKNVRIIAPTGKAALDINGCTTWTFAGWTPGHMKRPLQEIVQAAHGKFVHKRLNSVDVLVIDEISMVENHIFARLNALMKRARNNDSAFGGVQLVVTGDFCQLPPVKPFEYCMFCGKEQSRRLGPNAQTLHHCAQHGDCSDDDKWAFRSSAWEECKFKHINLTNIHRQSDEVFIQILQKLRIGNALTNSDRELLLNHPCETKNAVKLFPTRQEVRHVNQTEFNRLRTARRSYTCLDYFKWNEQHGNLREKGRRHPHDNSLNVLREHRLETMAEFKAGMLVVLLVNLDIANGLINGSQGRIIGFEPYSESKLPKASVNSGDTMRRSFDSPERGSKSRSRRDRDSPEEPPILQGELRGEYATMREEQIREFILQSRNEHKIWPIVEFDNGIRRTIYAECQVNELGDEKPYTLLARTQIPLVAAWAMTIHKSQGMTLNKVIVDLGKSFEEGQEYVALSRARSLDGLQVINLGENVGQGGNEQVKRFLKDKFGLC